MARYGNGPHGGQYGQHGRLGRDWKKIGIISGITLAVIAVILLLASPRSRTTDPAAGASRSPTPTATASTPTRQAPAPVAATHAQPPAPATKPTTKAPPLMATVPNVVGKDLQSAQEELFPPLRSTSIDATGRGRSQIIDSNWVVIRQEPAAGTTVLALTDIKLYVIKRGESAR